MVRRQRRLNKHGFRKKRFGLCSWLLSELAGGKKPPSRNSPLVLSSFVAPGIHHPSLLSTLLKGLLYLLDPSCQRVLYSYPEIKQTHCQPPVPSIARRHLPLIFLISFQRCYTLCSHGDPVSGSNRLLHDYRNLLQSTTPLFTAEMTRVDDAYLKSRGRLICLLPFSCAI